MIRLIYVSRSAERLPLGLRDVLETSRKNNLRMNITGALCHLDGVYLQYLEGDTVVLEDLYRRIISDPRHVDARLLERKRISERLFSEWSMALVTWDVQTRAIFNAFNLTPDLDLYQMEPGQAALTFEALSRSANWLRVGEAA
ncbi:MAG: BLUF domain-containing protein [Comamonadaceae bacterium]|nr:MAG: BLUF domain-containing protein [Comamonadaceae bacterium]